MHIAQGTLHIAMHIVCCKCKHLSMEADPCNSKMCLWAERRSAESRRAATKLFFSSSNFQMQLLRLLLSIICMYLHVLVSAALHNHKNFPKCIIHLIFSPLLLLCRLRLQFLLHLVLSLANIIISVIQTCLSEKAKQIHGLIFCNRSFDSIVIFSTYPDNGCGVQPQQQQLNSVVQSKSIVTVCNNNFSIDFNQFWLLLEFDQILWMPMTMIMMYRCACCSVVLINIVQCVTGVRTFPFSYFKRLWCLQCCCLLFVSISVATSSFQIFNFSFAFRNIQFFCLFRAHVPSLTFPCDLSFYTTEFRCPVFLHNSLNIRGYRVIWMPFCIAFYRIA